MSGFPIAADPAGIHLAIALLLDEPPVDLPHAVVEEVRIAPSSVDVVTEVQETTLLVLDDDLQEDVGATRVGGEQSPVLMATRRLEIARHLQLVGEEPVERTHESGGGQVGHQDDRYVVSDE